MAIFMFQWKFVIVRPQAYQLTSQNNMSKLNQNYYFSYEHNEMPRIDVTTHLYKCNHCIFSTSHITNLKVHMRRHNPEKLFKCNQCNYEGNQRSILNSHIRSTHNNLWHHCELCEYKASQKSNLKTHIQRKHEGVVFGCD